ncbi:MAG: orotidine-5'-phosphate decarboxylase [Chitinophagaceae bacterium]|nr:orotidine-5'-phosphate decarboxylase [Chitinophagaceae bacterium]MCA6511906.1 orotidine-5'-phosphate decarboxylase [Chitinophagaceae bacterium]
MTRAELINEISSKQSYLCVGLDTDPDKIPAHLRDHKDAVFLFNQEIVEATRDHCVAYKINTAFYESQGKAGWDAMEKTLAIIPKSHFTIADAKRGDIGNTSAQYAKTFFEVLPFDAITVAPYMGEDSLRPFLEYQNKWTIVLGLTSNQGNNDFQQLELSEPSGGGKLYQQVMKKVASWGNPDNLMFVVGATSPEGLREIRDVFPEHFFLVPGVGAQGGSLEAVSAAGLNRDAGLLVNVSRAIQYASSDKDFSIRAGEVAAEYHTTMRQLLASQTRHR